MGGAYWDTIRSAMFFPPNAPTYGLMSRFWLDDSGAGLDSHTDSLQRSCDATGP
jgi:hypothetical protein